MQVRFRSPCETQNKWFPYIIMQFIKYVINDDGKTQPLVADTLYEGKLQRLLVIFLFSLLRRRRNYSHFPWGVSGQSFYDWALMNFMYYTDILSQVLSESEKKYTHTHTKEKEKEKNPSSVPNRILYLLYCFLGRLASAGGGKWLDLGFFYGGNTP